MPEIWTSEISCSSCLAGMEIRNQTSISAINNEQTWFRCSTEQIVWFMQSFYTQENVSFCFLHTHSTPHKYTHFLWKHQSSGCPLVVFEDKYRWLLCSQKGGGGWLQAPVWTLKLSLTGTNSLLMLLLSLTSWRRHWADICSRAISPAQLRESITGADRAEATHTRALVQWLFGVGFRNVSSQPDTRKRKDGDRKRKKPRGLLKETCLLSVTMHI